MRYPSGSPKGIERLELTAAGMVHDLNNELTVVLNHLSTVKNGGEHVARAQAAAVRCARLAASLLCNCRQEEAPREICDASAFLREYSRSVCLPATVRLVLQLPPGMARIHADSRALRRVLDNLVLNACHAMAGAGDITISAAEGTIGVHDTGPGIAPADLEHLFEPFFTTKGAGGTGLGLAVVRELMERQGGSVAVRSEPGRGACFELCFPVQPPSLAQ